MTPERKTREAVRLLHEAQTELIEALKSEKSRRRGELVRQLHDVRRRLDTAYPYVSQAGQDFIVDQLLGGKRDGIFVDIGGYDGVTGSNTFFFEAWRGWTGLLVEPVETSLEKARSLRRCACVGCAIAETDGKAEFIEVESGFTQMSGMAHSYDPAMLERVRADARHREALRAVETRSLASLLSEHAIMRADFISLDIEGGELEVLRGFPFDRFDVTVWAIENNTGNDSIRAIMTGNGYRLMELAGVDEIYRLDRTD